MSIITMQISLSEGSTEVTKKYKFFWSEKRACGTILLEKWVQGMWRECPVRKICVLTHDSSPEGVWDLEIMQVYPQGKGFGSEFLQKVLELENLDPKTMTICPINRGVEKFFLRHGFVIEAKPEGL